MSILKDGEETKSKHYGALCCLPEGMSVSQEVLDTLNNYPVPVVLNQKTPIRVLHRRSMSTRKRTIYEMKATRINVSDAPTNLFKLQVTTQAGTYVKEFVHGKFSLDIPSVFLRCGPKKRDGCAATGDIVNGLKNSLGDLGRTIPSISGILNIETDIKLLDVEVRSCLQQF